MKFLGLEIRRAPSSAPEQRISPENPRYSLDDPSIMDALWMDAGSMPPVRPQRAVQTPAVYACTRILAESIAQLPLHLYQSTADGPKKADNLDEFYILHDEPNSYQTSYTWREQGEFQAALWGNAYSEIQRDTKTGRPMAFYPIPAWEVEPRLDTSRGTEPRKLYRINGMDYADTDIFHVMAPGWNGLAGISPIALMRASVTMSLNSDEFGANFFKNGTRLSGVLEHPGNLSAEAAGRLRSSWQDTYAGKANAGKVAVLEEGMKFNALTMPLADAQFIEQRKFQVTDIARIFRIPPHMVGDLERATFSNIEQQSIQFVQHTMMPWLARWEQELTRKLFAYSPTRKARYYAKFNLASLLRGDLKSRFDAYAVGRQWGWLSANDCREMEDLPPVAGGDTYLSPMNMVPANRLDDIVDKQTEKPQPTQPAAVPEPDGDDQ